MTQNKLAFSTLGCPTWDSEQILRAALDYGYNAIELRGYRDTMDLPNAEPFTTATRAATRARFADAGVTFCCVSSSAKVTAGDTDEVLRNAELARDLGAPFVRVFGGDLDPALPRDAELSRAAANLHRFGELAADAGVGIVLETHDSFSTGQAAAALIAAAAHPSVFSLWDLHHPYRAGETATETQRELLPTLKHIHVKNSNANGYCLPDDGDVPLAAMLADVVRAGYTGAISVEWEKRWHSEIAEPEIALSAYATALRAYLRG